MIRVSERMTFADVAARIEMPEQTVRQWAGRGLRCPDGHRRRLRTYKLGGLVFTSQQWLDEFLNVMNPAETPAAVA